MNWVELTKDAISEVMETMFFNVVEFSGEEEQTINRFSVSYITLTSDNLELLLAVKFDPEFAKQLTADFLGLIPEEVTESDIEDCMKELANMLAGSVIAKSEVKFALALPQYGEPGVAKEYECSQIPLYVFGTNVGNLVVCQKGS